MKVSSYKDSPGPNNQPSLKVLSLKLEVQLGVTYLERVSEIARFLPERVIFNLTGLTKKSRFQASLKTSFHVSFYSNPKLCAVAFLHEFEKQTQNTRPPPDNSKPNKILLSYNCPNKPVSSDAMGKWVDVFLSESGMDTDILKAHSVRGAASSGAMNEGVSLVST